MKIKVCGMREPANIAQVATLDIDFLGLIFYPKSSRYVSPAADAAAITKAARQICADKQLKPIRLVGVFVDETPQTIISLAHEYELDCIQLHGDEAPEAIKSLKQTLTATVSPDLKIIKALSIRSADDIKKWKLYDGVADMLLFDTQCSTYGGSGEQFDWTILQQYDGNIPFLLSGGIGPDDADNLLAFSHPQCIGIDLNSRFETAPALKDTQRLTTFINKIKP